MQVFPHRAPRERAQFSKDGERSTEGDAMSQAEHTDVDVTDVELDTDQVRKAQRVVALHSNGTDDCRMLLSMLGIGDPPD